MSTTAIRSPDVTADARVGQLDMKLEVVVIPVSDVGRAAEFYGRLGWRKDADIAKGDRRILQFTPPGSRDAPFLDRQGSDCAVGDVHGPLHDYLRAR